MAKKTMPWEEYDSGPAPAPAATPEAAAAIPPEAIPVGSEEFDALPPDANPAGFYDTGGQYQDFPEGVTVEEAPSYMAVGDNSAITRPERGIGESIWGGLQSAALYGFDDELQAGAGVVGNKIGNALGMNESTMEAGDLYNLLLQRQRQEKDEQWEDQPYAYGAGYVPGLVLGGGLASRVAAPGAGAVRTGATTGAAEGLATGFGNAEGNFMERSDDALLSAILGGGGGAALAPVAAGVVNVGGRALRRIDPRAGGDNTGLDVISQRAPQDPERMAAEAAAFRDAGVEPRVVDVVDESGRGVIRDAAGKMTPGRQAVVGAADQQYIDVADRVSQQAQRHISDGPAGHRLAENVREVRDEATEAAMDLIRNNPVPITGDVLNALSTREGVAALRKAQGLMLPEDRAAVEGVMNGIRALNKLDPRLPPQVRAQLAAEIFKDAPLTVDIADKFARVLRGSNSTPGLERVTRKLSDDVRGEARRLYPEYDAALTNYEGASRVASAAEGGQGQPNFLTTPRTQYQDAVAPRAVATEAQQTLENEAMRAAARDQVIERAAAGSGAGAKGTAKQLARGSEEFGQRGRNEDLLGAEPARALEDSMEREFQRHANTQYIDPRTGSQTQSRGQDAIVDGFAEAAHAAATVKSGGIWAVAREAGRWLRKTGIRDVDAARLSRDAVSGDPARVDAAIAYLADRGMARDRATRFVGAITGALSGATAGSVVPEQAPQPNSVRSLYQHGGR